MSKKDAAREKRISMEAIVDAYGTEEQAMGELPPLQSKSEFAAV